MTWNSAHWRRKITELQKFIEPLVAEIGRSERRESAALYVQGLFMPGQRKSIEPMAERLRVDSQKLQQFISDSPWPDRPVWQAICREVIPVVEPLQAWVVDETGWLKQGSDSVGVSHQYCGAVGKQAQCQVAVELVVSDGEVAAPVGGRLYLPEVWVKDVPRREKVGVPSTVRFQTKPEIAGDLIAEALADGLSVAPILGDAVYGNAAELRRRIRGLGLEYFFNAEDHWLAWIQRPKRTQGPKYWRVAQAAPKLKNCASGPNLSKRRNGKRRPGKRPMARGGPHDWLGSRFISTAIWTKTPEPGRLAGWWWIGRKARPIRIMFRCLAQATSGQRARAAIEPGAMAHRTVFSTWQRRLGLGSLRGPELARFSSSPNHIGHRLPVCGRRVFARQKKLPARRGNRRCGRCGH